MNLELDADATALVTDAGRVLRHLAPLDRLREAETGGTWRRLVDAGWSTLGAAVARGELDVAVVAAIHREAGRVLLVEQLATSGYLLAAIAEHSIDRGAWLEARLATTPGVLLGDGRDLALDVDAPAAGFCFGVEEPVDAYRLRRDAAGVVHIERSATSTAPERLAGLSIGVGLVRAGGPWEETATDLDDATVAQLQRETMLVHTAALIGCAEQLVSMTTEYVMARRQFDVVIASFQAVKHGLADVVTQLTVAWSAVLCAVADGATNAQRSHVARVLGVEAAMAAAAAASQFHGGIGFTWECDVHRFAKVILDGAQRFGSVDEHAEVLGARFREAAC